MRSRDQVVKIEDVLVSIDYASEGHRVHMMNDDPIVDLKTVDT